ncbi:efflux RND transporter permease subunit [Synechococcus sp. CCY9201]|uniref:efflux RND transporter permease subunit n=1 Tax=Synechococcus sp. CCY9201 TaxID=174697 RepID=UPI002B21ED80|nr:efflux RND transporter permease subunit [Synechococcus sp. CCY9201]MEA5475912.1 efflux RND transporter permease subunit [Synechococcus sp. CCY9201]
MKSVSDPFLRRPVLTLVCSLLVLLIGFVSLAGLPVENLPPIAPGRVSVRASYPGAGPEVVEQGVTSLLEKQLNGLERLDSIRSVSSSNGSLITLSFEGGDPEINQINTQNEATVVARQLPAQVVRLGVQVRRSSDDLLMVLSFSADRSQYDDAFLSGWVEQTVRDRLQRVNGVGEVALFGGSSLAFRLWLDPAALEERNLTIKDISDALEDQNVLATLGQVGEAPSPADQLVTLPLRMEGRLRSVAELEQLVVARSGNGGITQLREVGRVELGSESYDTIATNLAGDAVVAIGVFQRDGSNAMEVSRAVNAALDELRPRFPPGVELQLIVDEADNVRASIDQTVVSLRDAVLLVFLVLMLGLGNSRLALITAAAVPVALVGSLSVLLATGTSINTLSLFGMVLATGLVVDDAIVVSEDIGRRLENGTPPMQAAREAMHELGGAVIATSLVLVVVFLPILTLSGSLGRLYAPIAIAISAAIVFSTFNALTFTPVAASRLLHAERREPAWLARWITPPQRWLEALEAPYGRWLDRVMARPRAVLAVLLVGLLCTGWALQQRPTAFIPQEDGGQLRAAVVLPDGAALPQTQQVMEQVRQVIAAEPLVASGNFYAGRSFGDSSPNKGSVFLRLRPIEERRSADQSSAAVVKRLNAALRGQVRNGLVQLSEAPTVRGFSSEGGLELELLDTSGGQLSLSDFQRQAEAFIAEAQASGLFERVSTRFTADSPRLLLVPDRLQMASLGVKLSDVVDTLGASFGSEYVNDSFESDEVRRVIVQLDGRHRRDQTDVLSLRVRNRDGRLIPLAQLVRVEQDTGPTTINHSRLARAISIRALPKAGVSTGQAMAELERLGKSQGNSTDLEWAGLAREERKAGGGNLRVFALGVVVMVLVLAGLYENFADPFIILITVPLALLGAVLGLALRGLPLDVYGQMGLLVLVSLAAKNGILIVEFANQRLAEGMDLQAAIHRAALARVRPILLTAISSLAGFLPLLFASGAGSASRISIGTVVFFGLLVATVLTLFVVPVIYRLVKGWERRRLQPHSSAL